MDEKFVATLRRSTEARTLANEVKNTADLLTLDFENVKHSNAALTTQINGLSQQVYVLINQNIENSESSFGVLQFSNDSSLVAGQFNFFRPGNNSYIPYEITITCVKLFFGRSSANKDYSVELGLEVRGSELSSFPIELKTLGFETFGAPSHNRMLHAKNVWGTTIRIPRDTELNIRTKKFDVIDSLYATEEEQQNEQYYCAIYLYY